MQVKKGSLETGLTSRGLGKPPGQLWLGCTGGGEKGSKGEGRFPLILFYPCALPHAQAAPPRLPTLPGELGPEAQSVMRRLAGLIKKSTERLGGMVAQFDEEDKGYMNEKELVRGELYRPLDVPPTWERKNKKEILRENKNAENTINH